MVQGGNRIAAPLRRMDLAASFTNPGLGAAGFAIYERSGSVVSLFAHVWQVFPPGGMVTGPFPDPGGNQLPLALSGKVVAMAGQETTADGRRGKVDLLIKTGASWSTALSRTVLAGYRTDATFPIALSGSTLVTGNDWSAGESYHTRGVVEIFEGVTSPSLLPLRLTLSRPAPPRTGTFGNALFTDGTYLIAENPGDNETFPGSGAVHVWQCRTSPAVAGESWVPAFSLKPTVAATDAHFGSTVVRDAATGEVVIGAPDEPSGGSVFLFRPATGILTSLPEMGIGVASGDRFGDALAHSGNFLAVGMPWDPVAARSFSTAAPAAVPRGPG